MPLIFILPRGLTDVNSNDTDGGLQGSVSSTEGEIGSFQDDRLHEQNFNLNYLNVKRTSATTQTGKHAKCSIL